MENYNIGDRVVDKTSGKHGRLDSFIHPYGYAYKQRVFARLVFDDGGIKDVELHNLAREEGYEKPVYDNQGINALENPNDISEELTPKKTKSKSKKNVDAIVEATE